MEARYTAVYKIQGITGRPDTPDRNLVELPDLNARALLTTDPDRHCFHLDRANAISSLMMSVLVGRSEDGDAESRITAEVERVKEARNKEHGQGTFLIFTATGEIESPDLKKRRDFEDFAFCLEAFSGRQFRERFRNAVNGVVAALTMGLGDNKSPVVQRVGHRAYLVDDESKKVIYNFNLEGGMAITSISGPLKEDTVIFVHDHSATLCEDKRLAAVVRLLTQSIETTTDNLRSFLAAWAGFEIFVNNVFKDKYKQAYWDKLSSNTVSSGRRFFDRLKSVMKGKYNLADRFLVIASLLDETSADSDSVEFNGLKKLRDDLLHGQEVDERTLPNAEVQYLLRKYLRLHIQANK